MDPGRGKSVTEKGMVSRVVKDLKSDLGLT